MSGLAGMLLHRGCKVSGSDIQENALTTKLVELGASIRIGHTGDNILGEPTVIYSSAIPEENPEILEARDRGLRIIKRGELLGEFFNAKKGIAISGTHGKTTTTALTAIILNEAGLKPDAFIGGEVDVLGGNVTCGDGEYVIAEADESDGSLLNLSPVYSIVTNIEEEHLPYFKNIDDIIELFRRFISQTSPEGSVYLNIDNKYLHGLFQSYTGTKVSYSTEDEADIHARDVRMKSFGSEFTVVYHNQVLGDIELNIPGLHNVSNSLGPIALASDLGIGFETIRRALCGFRGAARRFERKGDVDGILVIDDYAHHPTEIIATINSAKAIGGMSRIIGVFQPHRFSRTKHLKEDFPQAFDGLDELILTDIYAANEEPIEGIDGNTILNCVLEKGKENVKYFEDMHDIPEYLSGHLRPGDVVLTMGAGNINIVAEKIIGMLKKKTAGVS